MCFDQTNFACVDSFWLFTAFHDGDTHTKKKPSKNNDNNNPNLPSRTIWTNRGTGTAVLASSTLCLCCGCAIVASRTLCTRGRSRTGRVVPWKTKCAQKILLLFYSDWRKIINYWPLMNKIWSIYWLFNLMILLRQTCLSFHLFQFTYHDHRHFQQSSPKLLSQ